MLCFSLKGISIMYITWLDASLKLGNFTWSYQFIGSLTGNISVTVWEVLWYFNKEFFITTYQFFPSTFAMFIALRIVLLNDSTGANKVCLLVGRCYCDLNITEANGCPLSLLRYLRYPCV